MRNFDRGMWLLIGLLLAFTVANALVAYSNIRDIYEARLEVGQSRQVQLALAKVLSAAQDAETGTRGYAITEDRTYLQPYFGAIDAIQRHERQLKELTRDTPSQRPHMADVVDRIRDHLTEQGRIVALVGEHGLPAARAALLMSTGRERMEALRAAIDAMGAEESLVLEQRAQRSVRSMEAARASTTFAALLAIGMLVALIYEMRRNLVARDEATQLMAEQRELFRTTLASLGDAVVACDAERRVTFINAAAERLTHWPADKAVGIPVADVVRIVDDDRHQPIECSVERVLREGVEVPVAHRGRLIARGAGSERAVEDSAAPLRDAAGRIVGAVLVFRDITERKRSEDALIDADRRKDEFLAVLAHELRNPLAPLRNALQIVRLAGDNRSVVDQAWSMMDRQVKQMVRLIDDLLDVSRITRNRIELRREPVDLREVVDAAVEMSSPTVAKYGHRVEVALPAACPPVDGDRARLVQVVDNLITNAAKYTPHGGRIALFVEPAEGEVTLRVKDNGTGIPRDMLEKVFEMFTQVDRTLERSRGGLGIGLTLVRRLVELHGGSVVAKSEGAGYGTELVVKLPVKAPQAPRPRATGEPARAPEFAKRRILVADDNEDSADSMARMLRMMGHDVHVAYDGESCLAACRESPPDVALLDIGMPRRNGYDAARAIRAEAWGRGVLLVAVTGWGQREDRERARAAGFDHHIVKPVDFASLSRIVHAEPSHPEVTHAPG